MIPARSFAGRRVALFGLGGSGLASASALIAGGADVVAWDDNPASVAMARERGLTCEDLRTIDLTACAALVLAPGVPLTHPAPHWSVDLAAAAELPMIGDVELFQRELVAFGNSAKLVAITGTNGKSTTTALIGHILRQAGEVVRVGGNIGTAVLELEPPTPGAIYVVECSSYQIDLAPGLAPDVGILLNITPDHLDRHGTMEHYCEVKSRLIHGAKTAIVAVDDSASSQIARDRSSKEGLIRVSAGSVLESGVFADGPEIYRAAGTVRSSVATLETASSLAGPHNAQNAAAAVVACLDLGVEPTAIQAGLNSFPGLAHRMERVGERNGVLFVNDSKATNAEAAAPALAAFDAIHWIAGGVPKAGGIEPLTDRFGHVAKAYLIGEAAADFAGTLSAHNVEFEISGTMEQAVKSAAAHAKSGEVTLLSPCCASFDQFRNFEVRGDAFRQAVLALPGVQAQGPNAKEMA
ncbi:MAG: UDP-N-acetylmuramoyl-L-alanine--D-glutamate ligase [Pseudomonadota bacterium]